MENQQCCPVPIEQIPSEEYKTLSSSWFFSLPAGEINKLIKYLGLSWLMLLPICLVVSSGSIELRNDAIRMLITSSIAGLILPILLLLRQWLSWNYILDRLISEKIVYEESGWYDGQTWEKPYSWREKDILIAFHDVKPITNTITKAMIILILIIFLGICYIVESASL